MITFFAVIVVLVIVMLTFLLAVGWLINRPDKGKRAKPATEDQRTITAWLAGEQHNSSFWAAEKRYRRIAARNVSRAGRPQSECSDGQVAAPAPAVPTSATSPGPGRSDVRRDAPDAAAFTADGIARDPARSDVSEACEPCTVNNCRAGCKCACHWPNAGPGWDDYDNHMAGRGPVIVRADAHYHSAFDLGDLLDRADAVLAGAL